MKKTIASAVLSLALMSSAAMAEERATDAALGAVSGASERHRCLIDQVSQFLFANVCNLRTDFPLRSARKSKKLCRPPASL
jgi:hypothetical protein